MKVSEVSVKVAAKVAKGKKKVAKKCGVKVAAKVATMLALALVLVGCASTGEQPARSQTQNNTFDDCIIVVAGKVSFKEGKVQKVEGVEGDESALPAVDLFTQAQSNAGSETIAPHATPTNTTDVDAALDVPVNKMNSGTSGAASGAAEKLLGAGADWLSSKLGSGGSAATAATTATAQTSTPTDCKDGSCTAGNCTDGSCSYNAGDYADGSCTAK